MTAEGGEQQPMTSRATRRRRGTRICAGALALLVAAVGQAAGATPPDRSDLKTTQAPTIGGPRGRLSLAQLLTEAQRGTVATATIDDRRHEVSGTLRSGGRFTAAYPPGFAPELTARLLAAHVDVRSAGAGGAPGWVSPAILFVLAAVALLVATRNRRTGQPAGRWRNPAGFSRGRGEEAAVPDTRFGDVAGADEAVEELRELVQFLRTPARFTKLGARLPGGYLLVGPPGTGKTLLARAVAGEAGVPFYAMSGSEFIETYVGVGASRMRTLFDRARSTLKAIVFIDEIDAIGKSRQAGHGGGANDERESTLNQLLVEMDGFQQSSVVVLAATNRPDTLDHALLRPGRFDRQVTVAPPDRAGRRRILELYARRHPLAAGVDLELLARRTAGFTGADLNNLMNQAALVAVRSNAGEIAQACLEEALATVVLGPARKSLEVAERDRVITAWHEAGHALAGLLVPEADDPVQVTIVPRGGAGGVTWFAATDGLFLTARQARARLLVALAGRVAEELHLGDDFTQGAANDFKSATEIARRMVTEFGMSTLGPRHIAPEEFQIGPLAGDVHAATHALLDEALAAAHALLTRHREVLAALVDLLLVHETVETASLHRLLDERPGGLPWTAAAIEPTPDPVPELARAGRAASRPRRVGSMAGALARSLAAVNMRLPTTSRVARAAWRATHRRPVLPRRLRGEPALQRQRRGEPT
jgi:cell division protease FtsH